MALTTIGTIQHTINRYASVGGFAPIATDGAWGTNTRTAMLSALRYIGTNTALAANVKQAAGDFQVQRGFDSTDASTRNTVLTAIDAYLLTPVANQLGLKEGAAGGGSGGGYVTPGVGPGAVVPTPNTSLTPTSPTTFSLFGLVLPRWSMYLGGGVLALAVVGLIATREKPATHAA